jgi:hypothetical protein
MENPSNTCNDNYETVLNVRITLEMEKALADHKEATLIPTAALVRRAIDRELRRPITQAPAPRVVPEIAAKVSAETSQDGIAAGLERRLSSAASVLFPGRK